MNITSDDPAGRMVVSVETINQFGKSPVVRCRTRRASAPAEPSGDFLPLEHTMVLPPPPSASRLIPVRAGLIDVLTQLGHRCVRGCGEAAAELGASVWFTHCRDTAEGTPTYTLVVINTADTRNLMFRSIQLLRQINACTAPEGIHVSERRSESVIRTLSVGAHSSLRES